LVLIQLFEETGLKELQRQSHFELGNCLRTFLGINKRSVWSRDGTLFQDGEKIREIAVISDYAVRLAAADHAIFVSGPVLQMSTVRIRLLRTLAEACNFFTSDSSNPIFKILEMPLSFTMTGMLKQTSLMS